MKKQVLSRLLLSGLLATSLFVVAGCGETAEEKQAKAEQMVQESIAAEMKGNIALADKLSKADAWKQAIDKLKEKGELKSTPVQISGPLKYNGAEKALIVDVVKPGTTELLRYRYDLNNDTWGDGQPVQVLGTGKNQIARTFYSIDQLDANMMVAVIEKFKQEGQTNPEIKDSYKGYFNKAEFGWDPAADTQYRVEQTADGRTDLLNSQSIDALYDGAGNLIELRVKMKGQESIKRIL